MIRVWVEGLGFKLHLSCKDTLKHGGALRPGALECSDIMKPYLEVHGTYSPMITVLITHWFKGLRFRV